MHNHFFCAHSKNSDPGCNLSSKGQLLDWIKWIHQHCHHESDCWLQNHIPSRQQIKWRALRSLSNMLQALHITHMRIGPPYPLKNKLIVTCRDFALWLVAICRTQGIPARMRVGFGPYGHPRGHPQQDHIIAEVLIKGRWQRIDARAPPAKDPPTLFNPYNLAEQDFITAGAAWLKCRAKLARARDFGHAKSPRYVGWAYLRDRLLLDAASLYGHEMQPYDVWGMMFLPSPEHDKKQCALLDELATITENIDQQAQALKRAFEHPWLALPTYIPTFDPFGTVIAKLDL